MRKHEIYMTQSTENIREIIDHRKRWNQPGYVKKICSTSCQARTMYKIYCFQSMFILHENREKFCFGFISNKEGQRKPASHQKYNVIQFYKKKNDLKKILQITSVPKEKSVMYFVTLIHQPH